MSHKILPNNLPEIAHPKLSTIKTKSYVNIEDFYERKILEKSTLEDKPSNAVTFRRHNDYPWAAGSFEIAHDFSKKCVYSAKYLLYSKVQKNKFLRQNVICKNLTNGLSSAKSIKKLPPLKKLIRT